MMARRGAFWVLASGIAMLAGCNALKPDDVIRYRVSVEVQTPQGLRAGNSVIESRIEYGPRFGSDAPGIDYKLKGQAVTVDLGGSDMLFALLRGESGSDPAAYYAGILLSAFRHGARGSAVPPAELLNQPSAKLRGWARDNRVELELPSADWPILVRFRDINDPGSVEKVEPEAVEVKRITIAVTDEEITTGIERKLGWLRDGGLTLDPEGGPTTNPTLAQTIRQREFSSEIEK